MVHQTRKTKADEPDPRRKHLRQLAAFNSTAGIQAFCPKALSGSLQELGVKAATTRKLAGQVMARLSKFCFEIYASVYGPNSEA